MKWFFRLVMFLLIASSVTMYGCGGGSGDTTTAGLITHVSWLYDTAPADFSSYDIGLNVKLYYDESIPSGAVDGFTATAPDGGRWTVAASTNTLATTNTGRPYLRARLVNPDAPGRLPLGGTWTFTIRLKDGTTSAYRVKFHEPGSSSDATHQYIYARQDYTPFTNPERYVATLDRFPNWGYTVQYSANNGGSITTTGFRDVRDMQYGGDVRAYNMYCWLYDATNKYLGYTVPEYSGTDHSSTGLVTPGGELFISSASTEGESGPVDLAQVKSIRVVVTDGAQYAPVSGYDYRSVSYLVPVN